jgi:hypothetical protein
MVAPLLCREQTDLTLGCKATGEYDRSPNETITNIHVVYNKMYEKIYVFNPFLAELNSWMLCIR